MYQISCQAVMIEIPIMDLIQSTAPAFVRFTGTTSSPRRALASSGTGSGVFAQGPLDKLRRRMVYGGRRRAGRRTRTCPAGENHSKARTVN